MMVVDQLKLLLFHLLICVSELEATRHFYKDIQ